MKQFGLILVLLSILLVSCMHSTNGTLNREQEFQAFEEIKGWVQNYYEVRSRLDNASLYELYCSNYRSEISYDKFRDFPKGPMLGLKAFHIEGIKLLDENNAIVMLEEFAQQGPVPARLATQFEMKLIKEADGIWYYNKIPTSLTKNSPCGGNIFPSSHDKACGN